MVELIQRHQRIKTEVLQQFRQQGRRVGVLFAGGPAPGGHRVIGAVAKQFNDQGIPVIGFYDGYEHLEKVPSAEFRQGPHFVYIGGKTASRMIEDPAILLRTSRANPGKEIKGPADLEDPLKTARLEHVLEVFRMLRVGALVSIGGDDTLKTANFLQWIIDRQHNGDNPRGVVHLPKTVDNDYNGIDWTFGFWTAVEVAGEEIKGFYNDAKATNSYHVVECMGRKAGWYTAAASMCGRGTIAIIPEQYEGQEVVDMREIADELLKVILDREKHGKKYGVICIAEGFAEKLPAEIKEKIGYDRHGNLNLGAAGLSGMLADLLTGKYKSQTGRKKACKAQKVGYETRQVVPNSYDTILTSQLGVGAFRLISQGQFGHMVTVEGNFQIGAIPFRDLIDPQTLRVTNRSVDLKSDFYALLRNLEEYFRGRAT